MLKTLVFRKREEAHAFAVDLGTSRTRVWLPGSGIVAEEPSTLACDGQDRPVAGGWQAWNSAVECSTELSWPVRGGVVVDLLGCRHMLRMILAKRLPRVTVDPVVLVGVPATASAKDQSAVAGIVGSVAGGRAMVVEEPLAAALGAETDVTGNEDQLVVDIGAGKTEVAWIRAGHIHAAREVSINANDLTLAEATSHSGGSDPFVVLAATIRRTARTPSVADSGANLPPLLVSGGGALVPGVTSRLREQTGLEVITPKEPSRATIAGLGRLLITPETVPAARSAGETIPGGLPC